MYSPDVSDTTSIENSDSPRHSPFVRVTHWITAISFLALLIRKTGKRRHMRAMLLFKQMH